MKRLIQVYLESGFFSEKLKELGGIACGFVDGDLEIVCAENTTYTRMVDFYRQLATGDGHSVDSSIKGL